MRDKTSPDGLAMADENRDTNPRAKLCKAKRRLFVDDTNDTSDRSGPIDDQLQRHLAQELARDQQQKKEKWNFDFENERPLEGRWQWERVDNPNGIERTDGNALQRSAAPGNTDATTRPISARGCTQSGAVTPQLGQNVSRVESSPGDQPTST